MIGTSAGASLYPPLLDIRPYSRKAQLDTENPFAAKRNNALIGMIPGANRWLPWEVRAGYQPAISQSNVGVKFFIIARTPASEMWFVSLKRT